MPVGCLLTCVITRPGSSPCRSANEPVRTESIDHARKREACAAVAGVILADHQAQLGFAGVAFVFRIGFRLRVVQIGKHLVAIADGDRGVLRLAVAQVAQADGRSRPAAGDFVHQVVAVLDGAAIDGGDDVARP